MQALTQNELLNVSGASTTDTTGTTPRKTDGGSPRQHGVCTVMTDTSTETVMDEERG